MDYRELDPDFVNFLKGNDTLKEVIVEKGDVYSFVAARLFKLPESECSEWREGKPYPEGKKRRGEAKNLLLAAYWYMQHANDVIKYTESLKSPK